MTILIPMPPGQYGKMHIPQWSASVTSCEDTRCHHWASAHAVLPRQPPWSTILNETQNTNKTQLLPSFLTLDRRKKAKQFWDPKQTLYSAHWCKKLHTNVKHYYSSWRAQLHFELSNVVNGQKFKKLLALNEALKNLWAHYGPIVVKLLTTILWMRQKHWILPTPCWVIFVTVMRKMNDTWKIWVMMLV